MGLESLENTDLTGRIIGCAMEVHKRLGNGFQEKIYQRALAIEMSLAGLSFNQEFEMNIFYRDEFIGKRRVDFLVESIISVEMKARIRLEDGDYAQAMNYLEIYNIKTGLLFNFGEPSLRFHRFTNKKYKP